MTWEEIKSLQQEGHDIASHAMNHYDLSKLSPQEIEYEVSQSKQCLLDQGINPKSFTYPFNGGSDEHCTTQLQVGIRVARCVEPGQDPSLNFCVVGAGVSCGPDHPITHQDAGQLIGQRHKACGQGSAECTVTPP